MDKKGSIMPIPAATDDEYRCVAWGMQSVDAKFTPFMVNKGKVHDEFIKFEMLFCGICHSDVHLARNDMGNTIYPIVPGHELVGRVVEVGAKVTKVKLGDNVGVGCILDSCLDCG